MSGGWLRLALRLARSHICPVAAMSSEKSHKFGILVRRSKRIVPKGAPAGGSQGLGYWIPLVLALFTMACSSTNG